MTANRKSGGANTALSIGKRKSGGSMVNITAGYRRVGGAWVQVWPATSPLAVSSPTAFGTYTNSPASFSPSTRTINSSTVTASGGTGSYSWARISGSTAITASAPSAATTSFGSTTVPVDGNQSAVFRVTSGSETKDVSVSLDYNSGF